ncbi:MAG: bifunctional 4-hydroxy-2-oxoglutarate aldolase/2-dehydro-3-deoxy-phosphogluconate aldolase [Spirochaetaceae bacterium]|jgi:2-dehydro-3-deoxyphosphogluconate aldolase/(4S)-4-hydroxy-2-oxoglutarate aldolase|nr:bifunctional 4-hydroxy-2-oxoglutarate aldolase/2-dehydro-3-deoxy-phosphogluconate aldolase [Spirochaetaceae bacterium]
MTKRIRDAGLVPVVKLDRAEDAVPLAKALKAGGLDTVEVTFRTAAAAAAIKAIAAADRQMLIGAGTILSVDQAQAAVAAGAHFVVCPGFDPKVVDWCIDHQVPVFPGTSNPSEVSAGLARGLTTLKFFPAEQSGGVSMLNALAGPFPQVQFMPTGGISEANLGSYVRLKNVAACGGSWMVKPELVAAHDWEGITGLCRKAVAALHGFTFNHLGLNHADAAAGQRTTGLLSLLGFPVTKDGASSFFCGNGGGDFFEVMKKPFLGTHGHVSLKTWNIDRALSYLAKQGFTPRLDDSAKWAGEPGNSPLLVVYLEPEVGGFAIHLNQA